MEKKVYLIYESSKGRKDLVFVHEDREFCCSVARDWKRDFPLVTFRVYEVPVGRVIEWNKSYVNCGYGVLPLEIHY